MQDGTSLELPTGDYRFRPTDEFRDYQSGVFSTGQFEGHVYTVVDATDTPVLEIEYDPPEKVSNEYPLYYFRVPTDGPVLCIEEDQAGSHRIRNGRTEEQLGVTKSPAPVIGNWELLDTTDTVQATLTRDTLLRHQLPFTAPPPYTLWTASDAEMASIETDKHWIEIDVAVSRRTLPVAVTLAFVFSVFVLRGGDSSYGL